MQPRRVRGSGTGSEEANEEARYALRGKNGASRKAPVAVAAVVLWLVPVLTAAVWAAHTRPKVVWLQSQSACVQLGVWEKSGSLGGYKVAFEVTGQDGMKYTATKRVGRGTDWVFAYFPADFRHLERDGRYSSAWLAPGRYSWTAAVNARAVAHDEFRVTESITESGYTTGIAVPR